MVPVTFKRKNETKNDYIKRYTNLLYDALPQTSLEDRAKCTDIRDKIIELNKGFFGYVVNTKFLDNNYVSYEDKYQGCIARFCECWMTYKWEGATTYRTDVSFAVFFRPRLGEMLERDFNEVQYSLRRSTLMKIGKQIDKYWSSVTYEDLKDLRVKLSSKELESALAIFGTLTKTNVDDLYPFLEDSEDIEYCELDYINDEYNDIVNLIIHEMIRNERKLNTKDINKLCEIYDFDPKEIKKKIPLAEMELYSKLTKNVNKIELIEN